MSNAHFELLASDDWRTLLRGFIVPFAFTSRPITDLGDDVLEIGSGPGLTTDILGAELPLLIALELDSQLAGRCASVSSRRPGRWRGSA